MKGDLRRRSHSVTGSNRDNKIKDIHTMTLLKTMIVLTVGVMLSSCAGVRTGGGLEPVNTKLNDPGRATYRGVRWVEGVEVAGRWEGGGPRLARGVGGLGDLN